MAKRPDLSFPGSLTGRQWRTVEAIEARGDYRLVDVRKGVSPLNDTCWGIVFEESSDGNYWKNQWHVFTDDGNGSLIATFEFSDHAVAFVERCGPKGSRTDW
jgi:hypothetical protein